MLYTALSLPLFADHKPIIRFGWVNASYIYGLQIVNAHMRRALGTLTPYETFIKAIEDNRTKALAELV